MHTDWNSMCRQGTGTMCNSMWQRMHAWGCICLGMSLVATVIAYTDCIRLQVRLVLPTTIIGLH